VSGSQSVAEVFRGFAFIIGAMKCGTTTLHFLLQQHPGIAMGEKKELNFFTRWEAPTADKYLRRAFPDLDKTRHIYTLDSSTNYAKTLPFPEAPGRLAAMPGHKRLVYMMRNPIDRIESQLTHHLKRGRTIDAKAVERAIHVSRYALHIDIYASLGLRPDMLLLDFDDLVADPVATARRVFEFMDIEPVPVEFERPRNVRQTEERYTTPEDEARYTDLLRDDVRQLIDRHKFEPATKWGIA
jgi:hypothetical protein